MEKKEIGARIRTIRLDKGWSINLASQIARIGASQLKSIEEGEGNPNLDTLFKIAEFWEVPVESFFCPEPPMQSKKRKS